MSGRVSTALVVAGFAIAAGAAQAEPIFLSRQYTRCITCHYSPTGGGLLTPYGRSLSRQELSTTGRSQPSHPPGNEEGFLWGALGKSLGPVQLGLVLRPAHLTVDFGGPANIERNFFMNADLLAAYQVKGFTLYGEVGRRPLNQGSEIDSYEYWVAHQSEQGLGFRVGRFLPAYGIRVADHTAFTRRSLGFDTRDQVYGLELSQTWQRHLLQLSVGPGRADSILDGDGRHAFTATGRFQMDLSTRSVLVLSGLFRDASQLDPRSGAGGVAFGFAPTKRFSLWGEADAQFEQGVSGGPAYTLFGEAGFEVWRGVWLKFSPQLRTALGEETNGLERLLFELELFPRTHWNVDVSYYRDRNRESDRLTKTFLAQLHLYI